MLRHLAVFACLAPVLVACGGEPKKPPKPPPVTTTTPPPPPPETEADREKKRQAAALEIVPDGSTCLPPLLKEADGPRLELAAIGNDAVICATDTLRPRLLGPVGCWKVDLASGELAYQMASPLPGRGLTVGLDDRCARGYCLPADAAVPDDNVAFIVWSPDGAKVAVLAGDKVHLHDAASKKHESSFAIRGDNGVIGSPQGIHWAGDALFVEAMEGASAAVWVFKADGRAGGPLEQIAAKDAKPLSTYGGSFVILDKNRVAVAERGYTTVTTYEVDSGKRAKLVRKIATAPCKAAEVETYWRDGDASLPPKCKEQLGKTFGPLIGADAVAGRTSFLVLLRGDRLGELGVLDAKTLVEKKSIKLPWCE